MLCARCGREIEPNRRFCRFCGASVWDDPTEETLVTGFGPPEEPRRDRTAMWAFIAGLLFVVCVAAALAAYFLLRDDGKGPNTGSAEIIVTTTVGSDTTTPEDTTASTAGESPTTSSEATAPVDLSSLAAIGVSSTLATQGSVDYGADNLTDGDPATCWAEGVAGYGEGETIEFTFADPVTIERIGIIPGYDKVADGWDRWSSNGRLRSFDLSFSDGTTETLSAADARDMQVIALSAPHTVTSMRLTITGVYEAAEGPNKAEDTSVSELHVWGTD